MSLVCIPDQSIKPTVTKGWKRDLTMECIEKNPGPSLSDVLDIFSHNTGIKYTDKCMQNLINAVKVLSKDEFPTSSDADLVTKAVIMDAFAFFGNSLLTTEDGDVLYEHWMEAKKLVACCNV